MSRLAFLFLLMTAFLVNGFAESKELTVAIVQFEMSEGILESRDAFSFSIEKAMDEALKEGPADLVIFPEYLGVFVSLLPWNSYLTKNLPFEEVWMSIHRANPGITSIKDLFISTSAETAAFLNTLWSRLAEEHDCYILAGSRFYSPPGSGELYNQAVVYDPEGKIHYTQRKHFLTEFETDIIGLDAGRFSEIDGFSINGRDIRLTICRDTFLDKWEGKHKDGFLWIDIKANGVEYTQDQAELFTRALPARLKNTSVEYGITACLTGSFLNLLWEGESSILANDQGRIRYDRRSRQFKEFEIMRHTFP